MPFPPAEQDTWNDDSAGQVVRPYAITAGRAGPDQDEFTLTTLVSSVVTRHDVTLRTATPEQLKIIRLSQRVLSVAELGAHLDLPVNVIRVLLTDLLTAGVIIIRSPEPDNQFPTEVLEAILDGLHAL